MRRRKETPCFMLCYYVILNVLLMQCNYAHRNKGCIRKKILRHNLWRHVIQCECNFLCLFPTAAVVSGIQRETSPTLTSFFFAFLGFSLVCKCIGTTTNVYVIVSTAVPSLKVLLNVNAFLEPGSLPGYDVAYSYHTLSWLRSDNYGYYTVFWQA